jgi:hypothetical protein
MTRIAALSAGGFAGLAKILIDLICKFGTFRTAVNVLIRAIGETDVLKRYQGIGQFVGLMTNGLLSLKLKKLKRSMK